MSDQGPASRSETEGTQGRAIVHGALAVQVERDGAEAVGHTLPFDGERVRIGAHPSNDVVLRDRHVSRFHVQFLREANGWRVVDYGSMNGTYVNGVQVTDARLPGPEAVIDVGQSRLRVREVASTREVTTLDQLSFGELYGRSLAMRKLFAILERVAAHDTTVLIEGESGTGKELVAGEIVRRSSRAEKPFVVVDCGAISPSLVEAELFGHARGAFTGADRERAGAFEAAHGGTVFLDEIGELPLELQPKLLRALEAREIRRVGEVHPRKVDVRVVAATNRSLEKEVNLRRFREDLYYRLSVISVRVPPLRERVDDIELLVRMFLDLFGATEADGLFTPDVLAGLRAHAWPGNVRELKNVVERVVVFRDGSPAKGLGSRRGEALDKPEFLPYREAKARAIDAFEKAYLGELLEWANGNLSRAARRAQMDRMNLHRLAQRFGLREGRGLRD